MDYEDFRVLVAGGPDGPEVRVLDSPEGEGARERFEVPVSEEDLDRLERIVQWRSRAASSSRRRDLRPVGAIDGDSLLAEMGERLYRCLFTGEVRDRLLQSLARAPDNLRIRLQLDLGTGRRRGGGQGGGPGGPSREGAREVALDRRPEPVGLHRLPWELLREPGDGNLPLALRRGTPVVRYLDVEGRPALPDAPETLVVLAVAPQPAGVPRLDLDRELDELRGALAGRRDVALRVLETPTLEGLVEALRGGGIHVLHFLGHGELDPRAGHGALVLEDDAGRARSVPAWSLVEQLADFLWPLRLVFLNACRTAEASAGAPWAGVATALVRAGVPAVLAMQYPVTDLAAATFAGWVYRRLAAGDPVDGAVADGRLALRRTIEGTPEWATPALFLRVPDGRVFAPAARREPGAAGEGRTGRPVGAGGRRRTAAVWLTVGLALLLLGVLVVLRAGAPPGGLGPVAGTGTGPTDPAGSGEPVQPGSAVLDQPVGPNPAGPIGPERAAPGGEPGAGETREAPVSAFVELALGESAYVREVRAHLTTDRVTVQGTELVRVTVSPDGGDSLVRAGFPGSTLRFPAGEEVLSVHVLSLDSGTGLVRLRARRSGS